MQKQEIARQLGVLVQLDMNTITAYDRIIQGCDDDGLRNELMRSRRDYERHVCELSRVIQELRRDDRA